ncbi:MAG: hypothetical protein RIC55_23270 [Pirellulaceae bacterium]
MFKRPRSWSAVLLLAVLFPALLLAASVFSRSIRAQVIVEQMREDVPVLVALDRIGLRTGETVEVTVRGEGLTAVRDILCDTVRLVEVLANDEKSARLKVEVAAGADPGVHPLHLLCEAGLSNPRLIVVGPLGQWVEKEGNNAPAEANPIEQPCAVSGVLTPEDRDFFRFQVAAGETVVFDLRADRIGSPVAGVLTLFDSEGLEIDKAATPSRGVAPDVRLVHRFEEAGTFNVCVTDRTFSGADYAAYHLTLSSQPFAESMFPLGGRRGETVKVELAGSQPDQAWTQVVELPSALDWSRARLETPVVAASAKMPAQFAVGDYDEHLEHEPNDASKEAELVTSPVTINGRIDRPGDIDCFRVAAKAGEKLFFEVFAARLGTPLDAVLLVRDTSGTMIVEQDDGAVPERLPPVIRAARDDGAIDDPRLEMTAPSDGEYVVEVRDRFHHGDAAHGYRLEISSQPLDFELIVQPGRVASSDPRDRRRRRGQRVLPQYDGRGGGALSIDRGGRGSLVVRAIRRGYNGPIEIKLEDVPPQLVTQRAVIAEGQNQVLVDLLAGFDAESTAAFIRVVGVGSLADRTITRRAVQPVMFAALPSAVAAQRELDVVAVGVSGRGAELALRGAADGALTPGGEAVVRIELRRREGVAGEVALAAVNLPSGIRFDALTLAADQSTAVVRVTADADATPGRRTLQIEGKLSVKDKKEPLIAIASLELDIRPLARVELLTPSIELTPGGAARLEFLVDRAGGEKSPVALEVSRLPQGVTLVESTLPAGEKSVKIEIRAEAEVRPSPIPRIIPIKPVLTIGGRRLELPAQRLVLKIVKPPS